MRIKVRDGDGEFMNAMADFLAEHVGPQRDTEPPQGSPIFAAGKGWHILSHEFWPFPLKNGTFLLCNNLVDVDGRKLRGTIRTEFILRFT